MARKEHLIWSSEVNAEDYDFDEEELRMYGQLDEDEELTEERRYELAVEDNQESIQLERDNLDIKLDNPILVIGNIGLWNGRVSGYKIIKSGNIKDILYSDDDNIKWYSDGYNIKGIGHHHDGTNYYEYREIKDENKVQPLLDALYNQKEVTREMIRRYTRSIAPHVHRIYGW